MRWLFFLCVALKSIVKLKIWGEIFQLRLRRFSALLLVPTYQHSTQKMTQIFYDFNDSSSCTVCAVLIC